MIGEDNMAKKIISVVVVVVMLFSVMATSFTASAMIEKNIAYGDIDNEKGITTQDARKALMVAAGLEDLDEETFKCADINSDGAVTVFDARQILRSVAGLVSLEPTGAFYGFKGYKDNTINVSSPEAAIAVFNTCLNRVKTEDAGFTRTESVEINDFDIEGVTFVGINLGNSLDGVKESIKEMITSEAEPEEAQTIIKGMDSDNAMSVETEDYVSKLSANDVYGIEVTFDGVDQMTIKVALADSEIGNIAQTAYADVFNTKLIVEDSENVIEKVFDSGSLEDASRKEVRNAVLTLVIDTETGNVVSYTTTYETFLYIDNSTFGISAVVSAELRGVQYGTKTTVEYNTFQW